MLSFQSDWKQEHWLALVFTHLAHPWWLALISEDECSFSSRLCASHISKSAVSRSDSCHLRSLLFCTAQTDLAGSCVPELAFGIIRCWISDSRFWKPVVQTTRSLAIWFSDFRVLIFVLGAWQTKDQAQKTKNEYSNTCGKHISHLGESKVGKTIGFRSKMTTWQDDNLRIGHLPNFQVLRRKRSHLFQTRKTHSHQTAHKNKFHRSGQRWEPKTAKTIGFRPKMTIWQDDNFKIVIFQTLWTYYENTRMSARHAKHVFTKQWAETNSARDVRNRAKTIELRSKMRTW